MGAGYDDKLRPVTATRSGRRGRGSEDNGSEEDEAYDDEDDDPNRWSEWGL